MKNISIGDKLPDFTLPDENGNQISIDEFSGKPLVIYFYPKDDTPGCTKQACSFRDSYEDFLQAGANVIGISSDSPEEHKRFKAKYKLPYTLLSDENNEVHDLLCVPKDFLGLMPGRVTYVIDKNGIVKNIFNSQFNISKHINESIRTIKDLN